MSCEIHVHDKQPDALQGKCNKQRSSRDSWWNCSAARMERDLYNSGTCTYVLENCKEKDRPRRKFHKLEQLFKQAYYWGWLLFLFGNPAAVSACIPQAYSNLLNHYFCNSDEVGILYRSLPSCEIHEGSSTSSFNRVKDRRTGFSHFSLTGIRHVSLWLEIRRDLDAFLESANQHMKFSSRLRNFL